MSRRTAKASKAVREAWQREQVLVLDGKGTRDWTPEQQQTIIEKGRAYDDDGKAFEGHHMKSVEAYPEYQSCADNIQFLSRSEHQDAHGGYFGNPTNGYYDYLTGETRTFGEEPYEPCVVIELSEPIPPLSCIEDGSIEVGIEEESSVNKDTSLHKAIEENAAPQKRQESKAIAIPVSETSGLQYRIAARSKSAIEAFKHNWPLIKAEYGPKVKSWAWKAFVAVGVPLAGEYLSQRFGGSGTSRSASVGKSTNTGSKTAGSDKPDAPDVSIDSIPVETSVGSEGGTRNSPVEHPVRSHERTVHTKDGDKRITVPSYTRGGKK